MEKSTIISALRDTLEAIGDLVRSDELQLAMLIHYAEKNLDKSDPTIVKLIDCLRGTPELDIFDGRMQVLPSQSMRMEFGNLASWMIRRSLDVEPSQVVADLERYLDADQIPCHLVFVLSGLNVQHSCDLGAGITLIPWNELQDSHFKRTYHHEFMMAPGFRWPRAALVQEYPVPKLHTLAEDKAELPMLDDNNIRDALLCTSLIGPFAPEVLVSWLDPPAWAPVFAGGASLPFQEGRPRHDEWSASHCESAFELFQAFRSLSASRRDALRLPIQRLNSAMCRLKNVDSAIDLGIALESIFLNDVQDDRGELTFRLRIRMTRWLENNVSKRPDLYRLIGDLYTLRSRAVHTGRVPTDIRKKPTNEILEAGFELTANAIKRIILEGSPDWMMVTLN